MVWGVLGLNPGLLDHWQMLHPLVHYTHTHTQSIVPIKRMEVIYIWISTSALDKCSIYTLWFSVAPSAFSCSFLFKINSNWIRNSLKFSLYDLSLSYIYIYIYIYIYTHSLSNKLFYTHTHHFYISRFCFCYLAFYVFFIFFMMASTSD